MTFGRAWIVTVKASSSGNVSRDLQTVRPPVAVVSLMTAAALEPLATAGSEAFIAYAILLSLMVGLFQFLLGVLRLGMVVNFLSHPVVNGFTNAAAIIIATSQLDKIFGVGVEKAEHHYQTVARVVVAAFEWTHLPTLGMAVLAFSIMVGLRKFNARLPNVLIAVVITTALSSMFGFEHNKVVSVDEVASTRLANIVEEFNFEEFVDGKDHSKYLWMNSAWALSIMVATFPVRNPVRLLM